MPKYTTVGPLAPETRDRVRAYRDAGGFDNYESTILALLENATHHRQGESEA